MIKKGRDSGKHQLFESVYKQYYGLVFSIVRKMTDNNADAEDIVQETFLRIARNISHISGINSMTKGYVVITARSTAVDYYRKNKKNTVTDSFEEMEDIASDGTNIEKDFIAKQEKEDLCRALMRLPDRYKEILILKYFEDLKNGEISRILNVPKETVRKRIQRGLERLRKEIEKDV